MTEAEFTITPVSRDGCWVLVLEGELDMTNSAQLDEALDAGTAGPPVIVDLTGLTFIESGGLHMLFNERDAERPAAIVRRAGSNIDRVLEIVHIDQAVPVYDDVATAVETLKGSGRRGTSI
jgi:anti-sigma B factor antagonist